MDKKLNKLLLAGTIAATVATPVSNVFAEPDTEVNAEENVEKKTEITEKKENAVELVKTAVELEVENVYNDSKAVDDVISKIREAIVTVEGVKDETREAFKKLIDNKTAFDRKLENVKDALRTEKPDYPALLETLGGLKEELKPIAKEADNILETLNSLVPTKRSLDERADKLTSAIKHAVYKIEDLKAEKEEDKKKVNELIEESKTLNEEIATLQKTFEKEDLDVNAANKDTLALEEKVAEFEKTVNKFIYEYTLSNLDVVLADNLKKLDELLTKTKELKLEDKIRQEQQVEVVTKIAETQDALKKAQEELKKEGASVADIKKGIDKDLEMVGKIEKAYNILSDKDLVMKDTLEDYVEKLEEFAKKLNAFETKDKELIKTIDDLKKQVENVRTETIAFYEVLKSDKLSDEDKKANFEKIVGMVTGVEEAVNKAIGEEKTKEKVVTKVSEEPAVIEGKKDKKVEVNEEENPKYKTIKTSDASTVGSLIAGQAALLGAAVASAKAAIRRKK